MLITKLHSRNSIRNTLQTCNQLLNKWKLSWRSVQVIACATNFPRTISEDNLPFHLVAQTFFIIKLPHCELLANKRFVYIASDHVFPTFHCSTFEALRGLKRDGRSWNFDHCVRSQEMKVFSFSVRACVKCQLAVSKCISKWHSLRRSQLLICIILWSNCFLIERRFEEIPRLI